MRCKANVNLHLWTKAATSETGQKFEKSKILFLKELTYAHQDWIYLIKKSVKTVIL